MLGRILARSEIARVLEGRLRVEDLLARLTPEQRAEVVERRRAHVARRYR